MARKKFTVKADLNPDLIADEIASLTENSLELDLLEKDVPSDEINKNSFDDLIKAEPYSNPPELEARIGASFKDFHTDLIVENNDKVKEKRNTSDSKKNTHEPAKSKLAMSALGSYYLLKNHLDEEIFELSISKIVKITGLGKSTAKKHREFWITNGWIKIIKEYSCSNQSPPTMQFIK